MLSGAIISAERCRYGRTSATDPVTLTPGSCAEPPHARRRIGADDQQLERRAARVQQRQRPGAEIEHALLIRVVVHAADEDDRIGIVGFAVGAKYSLSTPFGKPVRGDTGAIAFERFPFGPRRRRAQVEAPGKPLFGALHLGAFEPVAQRQGERLEARVLEPLLRVHVAEVEDLGRAADILDVRRDRRAMHEDRGRSVSLASSASMRRASCGE